MFLDSDVNAGSFGGYNDDVSSFGDENFLNHPGFLGITWSKKKAEQGRYDEAEASYKKAFPMVNGCEDIDDTISSIDKALTRNANSGAKSRVVSRNGRALENRRIDFKNKWDENNCTEERLEEQSSEFDTNIQQMFNEANQKSTMRKTEDDTLTNVSIGVGALVIGLVTYMAIR